MGDGGHVVDAEVHADGSTTLNVKGRSIHVPAGVNMVPIVSQRTGRLALNDNGKVLRGQAAMDEERRLKREKAKRRKARKGR